ncbi:IS1380 family transposase [Nitrosomonas sp. Nm132]|uniref:IS1380 family transposase n=1 Tax=Nitrosomonas sp. Nm132 TaxID=1881053 RepID=UPI000886AE28|nr:IS1380 family transposase [Nitrosomonas sp. Nm132]SDH02785.1 Transposase DDE domain group 1 [Nitrosomonas sp. Nm132]
MTKCTQESFNFPEVKKRTIEVNFQGGDITSDGGVMLLRQADKRIGLSKAVAQALEDNRRQASCKHDSLALLRQGVYALACGYEDLNDHQQLRHDLAIQSAVEREEVLASSSTLCRWENQANRQTAWHIHRVMIDRFMASFKQPPKELILDFDATDDAVHGKQEGRFFHGYYDHYCFLPLYVFRQDQLLVSYLRPSNIDGAKHAWAILSLLVKRFRQSWPEVRIIFRGDSGFCRRRMLAWCERHDVGYIVGIAQNKRLNEITAQWQQAAEKQYAASGEKVRWFDEFQYAAKSWKRIRRIIVKIEQPEKGSNPRYVVTNLTDKPQSLYDKLYCARGEMENRIKEQQLDLFADRTRYHRWWSNQFRLLLSSLAYILLETIRRPALQGTELAQAYVSTLRLKLIKIGAVVLRNTRHIRFLLASSCPYQELFFQVAARLASG